MTQQIEVRAFPGFKIETWGTQFRSGFQNRDRGAEFRAAATHAYSMGDSLLIARKNFARRNGTASG